MVFDHGELVAAIEEKHGTLEAFAEASEMEYSVLQSKVNNEIDFTNVDILRFVRVMGLTKDEVNRYFFTLERRC